MKKFDMIARCTQLAIAWGLAASALAQVGPREPLDAALLADAADIESVQFEPLDVARLDAEDALADKSGGAYRFAIEHEVSLTPTNAGEWSSAGDRSIWKLRIMTSGAPHLYLHFGRFDLPPGGKLFVTDPSGNHVLGPYTEADELPHGQLVTQIVPGETAIVLLDVPTRAVGNFALELAKVWHGYRGFGVDGITCKSGACNMDVACLGSSDPWNLPRRSAGATVRSGGLCSGSLVNNTANDRRMLLATARHCGVTNDVQAAAVLVYWRYESPTCRTPGSGASGQSTPRPNTTSPGVRLLATTNNPFSGCSSPGTCSDFSLIELATPAPDNTFNLYWSGWDRRPPPAVCTQPADPTSTTGLCASIHHPDGDEKRITFVQVNMIMDNIAGAAGVHFQANWDPNPPLLPNISPPPGSVVPGVTEPGSSGSPLYNAQQQLVGVLSGGPSSCGATGGNLRDQYGGLFHAWEGLGTSATRMRDHLDPVGGNPETFVGLDSAVDEDLIFGNGFE